MRHRRAFSALRPNKEARYVKDMGEQFQKNQFQKQKL
jgi:hypothetical protein